MAFNPNSTVCLCNVPIDNTYKNQIYFPDRATQRAYFSDVEPKRFFTDYLTVRETLPNGSLQSSIKVNANIDELYKYNYMYYQNANHGTRYFYAFITKLIYINEGTTKIVFETDVWQTWFDDITIMDSFVVREHSNIYEENIRIPEKFKPTKYNYQEIKKCDVMTDYGYLILTSETEKARSWWDELFSNISINGALYSGIYQGCYFFYFNNSKYVNKFLSYMQNENDECIVSITTIPKWVMQGHCKGITIDTDETLKNSTDEGIVSPTSQPIIKEILVGVGLELEPFEGYSPINAKLYRAPYQYLVLRDGLGNEIEYNLEDFDSGGTSMVSFKMCGDVCANPSVMIYPLNYKGVLENLHCAFTLSNFPQCSFNTDVYKLWLNKNAHNLGTSALDGIIRLVGGIVLTAATQGVGAIVGAPMIANGANTINGIVGETISASHNANEVQVGNTSTNLLTGLKKNDATFYLKSIYKDEARMIDDYLTMYGYLTNRVKTPNLSNRKYFNYIETIDINIKGKIPCDDMNQLKAMFNNGVTLWKSTAVVGDYSVKNVAIN